MRVNASALALLLTSLPIGAAAQQVVDWQNPVNVAVRGNALEKTRGCDGCDDAGAASRQMIRSGEGYVEFTVGDADSFWVAGLGRHATTRYDDVDFAFMFNGHGWAGVTEHGIYQGGDTDYGAGDVFRIAVRNGRVEYSRNGRVLYESRKAPQYPLLFDAALGTIGASVRNARIETGEARASSRYDSRFGDEFDQLDFNGDRVIARNEWNGSQREFNQLDTNRDGRLTRQEFRMAQSDRYDAADRNDQDRYDRDRYTPYGQSVGTSGQTIRVDARERWTDTGIWVQAGDVIGFDADGTIQMSADPEDGANPNGSWRGRQASDAPVRQAAAGTLIARIGNSGPFVVSDRRSVRAPATGRLLLGVNDDYLGDNSGEYRVTITVQNR